MHGEVWGGDDDGTFGGFIRPNCRLLTVLSRDDILVRMRISTLRIVCAWLIFSFAVTSRAQQAASLSPRAAAVKQKADYLSAGDRISVVRIDADEEFGTFVANDQEGFTFHDVDRKTDVTLKYDTVKKIKNGYGGYNSINHRHVDRRRNLIVAAVVVVGLVVLIVAAGRS